MKDRIKEAGAQANQGDADGLQARLMERLAPLLAQLDQTLAKRLVRAIGAIVSFRHSGSGLLLSELGAYDFLLSLLPLQALCDFLLRHWCHRTGKRCRDAPTPLYRLRSALSRLWLAFPPESSLPTPS